MKKVLVLIFVFVSVGLSGQSYYFTDFRFGFDLGFSAEGYMPVSFYLGKNKQIYGMNIGVPLATGQKGEYYSNINWDEYPEDIIGEGEYSVPFSFFSGYNISDKILLGAGIGYAMKMRYRNMYDEFHILGNNGSYSINVSDGGKLEYNVFGQFFFPTSRSGMLYIKVFYSNNMGPGGALGFEL